MAPRREILGVALIALTASTVLTMFIVGERADTMIEVLENTFPEEVRHDQRNTFSLAVIARKPISILELEVSSLNRINTETIDIEMGTFGREGMLSLDFISSMMDLAMKAGSDPIEYEREVTWIRTPHDLYVMDFTDTLLPILDNSLLAGYSGIGVSTIFAGVFNETGLALLFSGFKDYFPRRNITITEMSINFNDEKDTYKRIKELSPAEIASGVPTLLDAPDMGRLTFEDVEKDDTIRLAFSVDKSTAPYRENLELIRIFADAELEEQMANFFNA